MINHGNWPFNQYGSFWIFLFTLGTWPLSSTSILLGIRVITILSYWIAGFLLYKIAREFMSESAARWTGIYFFLSQPFFGGWNSSFLPWPSALAMPMLLGATLIIIQKLNPTSKNNSFSKFDSLQLFLAGVLFAMLYGTRLQIGILGTLVALIFLQLTLGIKGSSSFLIGNILFTLAWSLYLQNSGWLKDSLVDSVQLASTFLSGNEMVYPKPIATGVLTVLISLVVIFLIKLPNESLRKVAILVFALSIPVAIVGIDKLRRVQNGHNDFINYLALLHRKFMAGFFFATLLLVSIFIVIQLYTHLRARKISMSSRWLFLTSMSMVAAFQAWPFFDQMHIWWGSVPGVVLIIQVVSKLGDKFNSQKSFASLTAIIVLLTMSLPLAAQFAQGRKELRSFKQNHIYGISIYEKQNIELTQYFRASMPEGSKILNLCPNADPFFVDLKYVQVTRFPVYWMSFSHFSNVQRLFIDNSPEFIVTCKNLYYSADATINYRRMQKTIISQHESSYKLISHYSRNDFDWEVYRRN